MNDDHDEMRVRVERQQAALLGLGRRWRWYEADLDRAVAAVVETATVALDVERASVWFYDTAGTAILCHDLYEATARRHSQGVRLSTSDNPSYFEALQDEELISAEDAKHDPRTAAFAAAYLDPLGIGAMLDAPIRFGGHAVGVLCLEHVGKPRHFCTDEQNVATFLANLVSLAYEFQRRERSELERAQALSLLRAAFEASGAGILALDHAGSVTAHNHRFIELWHMPETLLGPEGDGGIRVRFVASLASDPDEVIGLYTRATSDPELEGIDVFELNDGRSIECATQPQLLDGQVIGRVLAFRDVTYQRRIERELRELAIRDGLTGLFNRRSADDALQNEIRRAHRSEQPLCVAMLDIDHFKQVNDTFGHLAGDDVLRQLAVEMRTRIRATDIACRWGGEEFLLILPNTDLHGAVTLIDQLRREVARARNGLPPFTVSAGVAQYDGKDSYEQMVATADEKLYEAKHAGRNRIAS